MPLDESVVYATYEDDGAGFKKGGQLVRAAQKVLLIFPNMKAAKEYEEALTFCGNGSLNPRITGLYSFDAEECLFTCWPAKIVESLVYIPK